MITWRFASAADIEQFYGERPHESVRAIVIVQAGEPTGVIGLAIERNRMRAFSECKEQLRPFLKSMPVLRAIKAAQRMFAQSALPVLAVKECDSDLLERLGFVQLTDEVYQWPS